MIPKRHSSTRLERKHPKGLTIYYKRANDEVEEQMVKLSFVSEETNFEDTLRSSFSSQPESVTTSSAPSLTKSSSKSGKKEKTKSEKRMTSRPIHVSKKWRKFQKRQTERDRLDNDTIQILEDLKILNCKIRKRFQIGTSCPHKLALLKPNNGSSSPEALVSSKRSSSSQKSSLKPARTCSNSPVLTAEAYDYMGVPLKNSHTATPFPCARSVNSMRKARESLMAFAKKDKKGNTSAYASTKTSKSQYSSDVSSSKVSSSKRENNQRSKNESESHSDSPAVKLTRVSSDTRFPGARSPATRERVRLMLKQCALKKRLAEAERTNSNSNCSSDSSWNIKSNKERKSAQRFISSNDKSKKFERKEKESVTTSLKSIYSENMNMIGFNSPSLKCICDCAYADSMKKKKKVKDREESTSKSTTSEKQEKKKKMLKEPEVPVKSGALDKESKSKSFEVSQSREKYSDETTKTKS